MGRPQIAGLVLAVLFIGAGIFLWTAGMGWVGESGDTSQTWANIGGGLAGLGIALAIVVVGKRK